MPLLCLSLFFINYIQTQQPHTRSELVVVIVVVGAALLARPTGALLQVLLFEFLLLGGRRRCSTQSAHCVCVHGHDACGVLTFLAVAVRAGLVRSILK